MPKGERRDIPYRQLCIVYDTISHSLFGRGNYYSYSPDRFLLPVSRLESLRYDLQILQNTEDALASLTHSPLLGIFSRKQDNNNEHGVFDALDQAMMEAELSGQGTSGLSIGKNKYKATNTPLEFLDAISNLKKGVESMILSQNTAKKNIQVAFGIPSDIHNASSSTTGKDSGSTYENQHIAEARFTTVQCAGITDKILDSLTHKNAEYFKSRGTKLIGSYDHLPSVIRGKELERNESIVNQLDALNKLLEAKVKADSTDVSLNIENYLKNNGFEDLL